MIPFTSLLTHSLLYGALLSVLMTATIIVSLLYRPMIWVGDAPPEVQAAVRPMTAAEKRLKRGLGAVVLLLFLGVLVASLIGLRRLAGGALSFADAALSTFIVFMTFNVVDLVLIDWLLVERLWTNLFTLPGAEGLNVSGGDAYHFRGFLKGTLGGGIVAAVIGGVAALVW